MSFQEEDEWLGLGQGFVLDDAFKCTSPLGPDTTLQVPLREPSPIAVSPQDLMDFSFPNDNSLSVPIREYGQNSCEIQFQSGNDPPRLSPVSSSYQSMAPLQNVSYEMSSTTMVQQQEESYNSFEQPSVVVNGHYQTIDQQIIQPQQGYYQAVPDTPQQVLSNVSTPHPPHASTPSGSTPTGSVVQQMLNAPSNRQTPTPQQQQHQQHPNSHPRQRPIQPKTHNNGRKRGSVNSHSGVSNKSTKVDPSASNSNQTEVRFSMSALTRITEIGAEMAQLQEQQDKLGINNSQRLSELQAQRASILLEALSSQNVGETVLSQVKQVAAAASTTTTTQPRPTPRSRASHAHSSRQQHFEHTPESPQYQPQMYLASHNQYPSTSTAQFQEFPSGNVSQAQVVHQQEQVTVHRQPQQRVYRTQNATTTVFHTSSQLPPGTVYVQNVPQASQAQYTANQPTVGEVVRQQHQLRHVSGAQQVIVQQVAAPQMVVTTGGQSVAGTPIRTQIVQNSPIPAQIVLAPAAVQQPPQMVVVAPRSTPAQTAKRLEEKRAGRLSRLRNYFENLHDTLSNPDTETPFTDLRDVLQRLLPYHAYGEPSFSEEHLEQFDSNYLRATINLSEQRKRLEKRLRKVFYDEALRTSEVEEENLLLYLEGEYVKRKLEEEKEYVKQGNLEAFVRDSPIVAALRDSDPETLEKARAAAAASKPSSSKSIMQQYEYHPFDETPLPVSPYKSPSPFKSPASSIRSPSPCKSPASIPYSPRIRARNASLSQHSSPAPVHELGRSRTTSKSRTTSETASSPPRKAETPKAEHVRTVPPPPPLPSPASRRTSASSPVTTLAARKAPPVCPVPTVAARKAAASKNVTLPPKSVPATPSRNVATASSKNIPAASSKCLPTPSPKNIPLPPKNVSTASSKNISAASLKSLSASSSKNVPVPPKIVSATPSKIVSTASTKDVAAVSSRTLSTIPAKNVPEEKPVVKEEIVKKEQLSTFKPIPEISNEEQPTAVISSPEVSKKETSTASKPALKSSPGISHISTKAPKRAQEPPHMTSTPGRLPAKKELLSRARQGVPLEMRSPPAHTSIASSSLFARYSVDDYESDGSASPELGVDDVIPHPAPKTPPMQPAVPLPTLTPDPPSSSSSAPTPSPVKPSPSTSVAHPHPLKRIPIPPPPHRPTLQRPPVPIPPPLPQKKEKVLKTPERTTSPVVKQENVKPAVKTEEEKPAERFRFKPQVPRPTPVSPLKPTLPKRETQEVRETRESRETPAGGGFAGKDVNCKENTNHLEENEKVQVANCVKLPPIRLKLKFDGAKPYIESNENSEKDEEKKHGKHKKKKKERDKQHKGVHDPVKVKHRSKDDKKHKKKNKHVDSPQELVAVTKNGKRLKVRFGLGGSDSRCSTPSKRPPSVEVAELPSTKQSLDQQPSTSKSSSYASTEAPKIPRLRIRIGDSPALVIEPTSADAVPETAHKHHHHHYHRHTEPTSLDEPEKVPKENPVKQQNSDPLAVEFSDDSDTEAERIRTATDEALRGMANLTTVNRPNAAVLPWSTQPAP